MSVDSVARSRTRRLRKHVLELEERIEALEAEAPVEPEPEPEEPFEPTLWTTERTLSRVSDWNSRLIEGFKNATLTDTPQGIRYYIPGNQNVGSGRCEVQAYHGTEGQLCGYEWPFLIPAHVELSTVDNEGNNTICQTHGDKNAGYTGGIAVRPSGLIVARVKGGEEHNMGGSHEYDYEETLPFGYFERDRIHRVRFEVLWHREKGNYRVRLDDGDWEYLENVPTWPIGNFDGVPTTKIMFRTGWYPQKGIVEGDSGLEMFTGPLDFDVRG